MRKKLFPRIKHDGIRRELICLEVLVPMVMKAVEEEDTESMLLNLENMKRSIGQIERYQKIEVVEYPETLKKMKGLI